MEVRSTPRTTSTGRSAASRGSIVPNRASHHTSGVSSLSASSTTMASGSRSARSRTACSTRTTCTYGSDGNRSGSRESTSWRVVAISATEGDQVPDRARTRHLQCRSQHLRALDDVLARPRPGHGLQRSAPRLATDHAEPEPSQVGGGLAQHAWNDRTAAVRKRRRPGPQASRTRRRATDSRSARRRPGSTARRGPTGRPRLPLSTARSRTGDRESPAGRRATPAHHRAARRNRTRRRHDAGRRTAASVLPADRGRPDRRPWPVVARAGRPTGVTSRNCNRTPVAPTPWVKTDREATRGRPHRHPLPHRTRGPRAARAAALPRGRQPVRLVRLRCRAERAAAHPGAVRARRRLVSRPRGRGAGLPSASCATPRTARPTATPPSWASRWAGSGSRSCSPTWRPRSTCRRRRTSTRGREPHTVNADRNRSSASSGSPDAQPSRPTTPS